MLLFFPWWWDYGWFKIFFSVFLFNEKKVRNIIFETFDLGETPAINN